MRSLLILIMFVLACGDDDLVPDSGSDAGVSDVGTPDAPPPEDAEVATRRIQIGAGLTAFTGLAPGSDIELVAGPQGGWHVNLGLLLYGIEPEGMLLRYEGFDAASGEALSVPIERRLTRTRVRQDGDHWIRLGDQLVFAIESPADAIGKDLRIRVTGTEAEGPVTEAELTLHVVDNDA